MYCELVILNGGEASVRDRMRVGSFDVVDGNAHAACSVYGLGYRIAALCASLGPSEGWRPPQDDNSLEMARWLLLCFQDVTQQVWFGFVADQMGIHFAAVVVEFVGFVVIGVFY